MARWTVRAVQGMAVSATLVVLAACGEDGSDAGGEEPGAPTAFAGFCETVQPRVDAFLASQVDTVAPREQERYGGTAVAAGIGELADGMDAFLVSDYSSRQHQRYVNLMTLVRYDEELQPQPWLAESWELSEDGRELTFHLRDDILWHDGEPTDAEDVAFTYRRMLDPATGHPNAGSWAGYLGGEEGVEVVDAHTIRVRMDPRSGALDPWTTAAIMPEHLLGEVPPERLGQHPYGSQCPVGNGPFVFQEHLPGDRWSFTANPVFPAELGGRPYLDRYVFRVIPEPATLLTELLTGGLDVYVSPAPDQAEEIIEAPNTELRRFGFPSFVFVAWNSRRPELADSRVRRALTMGLDRDAIVESILQGYATVANAGIPPFHWAHDLAVEAGLDHDPAAARALLDEAGWTDRDGDGIRENADGLPLSFTVKYNQGSQQRQSIAEIMQAQLGGLGIDARPQVVEYGTLLDQLMFAEPREFDGVVMSLVAEFRLDETDLFHSRSVDGPMGWSGTTNDRMDQLLDQLRVTSDREEARALWTEYLAAQTQEQPYTFLYFPDRLDGVHTRLRGAVMDPRGEWQSLKDWWIAPEDR